MPVNDPPPFLLPAEEVRHPQRRLDRVRDVLVNVFKQVLAVKPALGVPGGSPVKTRFGRGPALQRKGRLA
jgi:hypothetical protein